MSKIQVNEIVNHFDTGAPDCPKGLTITGVVTATTADFSGNVSIGGTLTYEDVTNIDSVGIITAQSGVHYGIVGSGVTIDAVGAGTSLGFLINGSERARIDSSGRLLVGTSSSPSSGNGQYARLAVQGSTFSSTGAAIFNLQSGKAAASLGSTEDLGFLQFTDNAGNEFAWIRGIVDGSPGASDYPGALVFSTTADAASSPTERMRLSQNGALRVPAAYTLTTGNAANCSVQSDGTFQRSTSSIKYKTNVEDLDTSYTDALLSCRPVWYRSTSVSDNPNHSYWGFIAEEVAKIDPRLVHWKTVEITYDEDGAVVETPCEPEPEGVQYDRFVPHLLNLIKRQKEQIEAMEARLSALEAS